MSSLGTSSRGRESSGGHLGTPARVALGALLALVSLGCEEASVTSPAADSASHQYVHDAGQAIAGDEIRHDFTATNTLDEAISLSSDMPAEKSCTCLDIQSAASSLAPGESTTVSLKIQVRTADKEFSQGAALVWKTASGGQVPMRFTLRGRGVPPVDAEPGRLSFSAEEIAAGTVKEIALRPNVQIDWSSVRADVSTSDFEIISLPTLDNHTLRVKCLPADNARGNLFGGLTLTARREGGAADVQSRTIAHIELSGRQAVRLAVQPSVVPVRFDPATGKGTGQVLLTSDIVDLSPPSVPKAEYPGFDVTCRQRNEESTSTNARAAAFQIEFSRAEPSSNRESGPRLTLTLDTGDSVSADVMILPIAADVGAGSTTPVNQERDQVRKEIVP